jgi:hypothetical protein
MVSSGSLVFFRNSSVAIWPAEPPDDRAKKYFFGSLAIAAIVLA